MSICTTNYWHKLDDGRVQCDLCPRHCKMHEGQFGLCSVRGVINGEVMLLSYGEASGFCIDPIEKKPLNHFLPGTPVLSFGQVGCNLTCRFCQNWDISKKQSEHIKGLMAEVKSTREPSQGHVCFLPTGASPSHELEKTHEKHTQNQSVSPDDMLHTEHTSGTSHSVLSSKNNGLSACSLGQNWDISKSREFDTLADAATPQAIATTAKELGCKSVAFTYNDPVVFLEYAVDTAIECHKLGVKTVAVTAGYISPEPRREFYAHMDAANVDLKGFTEEFYQNLCTGHLADVLDTLVYLKHETKVWFELTTLLIPGQNDSASEIDAMTKWVVKELGPDVPMHFTAFHPDWKMLDIPSTPHATLLMARQIALDNGVRYAYVGNVHDLEAESTYCHSCGQRLIGRDWYVLSAWNLTADGHCTKCGETCAGVFDGPGGDWGAKRRPVNMTARMRV